MKKKKREKKEKVEEEVKYPDVTVKLLGGDGNAFGIMGKVKNALRAAGVPKEETDTFLDECMQGDYNHLLQTCMRWVNVE